MTPDEQLDQRLHRAGAAWRDDQPGLAPALRPATRPASTHRTADSGERRRRWAPAVSVAAVLVVALAAVTVAGRLDRQSPAPPAGSSTPAAWTAMSPAPLSPRRSPNVIALDADRTLVLGGRADPACPPTASCIQGPPPLTDGAVYDLRSRAWTPIADAPEPIGRTATAVLDGVVYVLATESGRTPPTILGYDLAADGWTVLPPAPVVDSYLRLTAAGDRLVASYGEVGRADALDVVYDPTTQRWTPLPRAPFAPSFDRSMVWTGSKLVLVAAADTRSEGIPFQRAAVLEGSTWRVLPPQRTVIFGETDWAAVAGLVVSASTATADGGQTNRFGRAYPSGGLLDPGTGRWSELPEPPTRERATGYGAAGERYVAAEGLVLDVQERRWLVPGTQPDAAEVEAGAAWAGDRLVVWGGAAGLDGAASEQRLLGSGAIWTPPTG